MSMTCHSKTRSQQRGIPPLIVDWIRQFGQRAFDHRGGVTRYLDKASKKALEKTVGVRVVRQLEAYMHVYVVESVLDGTIITIGHRYKRIPRS